MIEPISNEKAYERAMARIDSLIGTQMSDAEGHEFDALVTLVEAYESKHFPMGPPPGPIVFIEFMMEQNGLSRRDLEPMIGSRARVSEVLSGKRSLTLAMIRRLHQGLRIPVEFLIGTIEVKEPPAKIPVPQGSKRGKAVKKRPAGKRAASLRNKIAA